MENSKWYIYIVKTENGDRIGIDEYYEDTEIDGEYLEKGFNDDTEANERSQELGERLNIKLYDNRVD